MVGGHERVRWTHTSTLAAYFVSATTGEKITPDQLNPYRQAEVEARLEAEAAAGWDMLAGMFGAPKNGQ